VAIAVEAGPMWPMKQWNHSDELKRQLEARGLTANILPRRSSLLEHLSDVRNHRCLVSGDSLPMHLALGTGKRCVTLFTCTSPWEIYDYGLQRKIISPLLEECFYKRGWDERATTAISVEEVVGAVMEQLQLSLEHGQSLPTGAPLAGAGATGFDRSYCPADRWLRQAVRGTALDGTGTTRRAHRLHK